MTVAMESLCPEDVLGRVFLGRPLNWIQYAPLKKKVSVKTLPTGTYYCANLARAESNCSSCYQQQNV